MRIRIGVAGSAHERDRTTAAGAATDQQRPRLLGRDAKRAEATVGEIRSLLAHELDVEAVSSLEDTVRAADIVSCAASSVTPVLAGKWLRAGTFVDLVGSFSPSKREADDELVQRSRLFVNTFEGALAEAGDLIDPLARGVIDGGRIEAELADRLRALDGTWHGG